MSRSHPVLERLSLLFTFEQMQTIAGGIQRAIIRSAHAHPQRGNVLTGAETTRRIRWCVELALELRKGHRWPSERIADEMPGALDCYLRTGSWSVPQRSGWIQT